MAMTSKHCPYSDLCRAAGHCQSCVHGQQYERMGHKLNDLYAEAKRFKQELAQARQALMTSLGRKEAAS